MTQHLTDVTSNVFHLHRFIDWWPSTSTPGLVAVYATDAPPGLRGDESHRPRLREGFAEVQEGVGRTRVAGPAREEGGCDVLICRKV